jgi:hypothetical protein
LLDDVSIALFGRWQTASENSISVPPKLNPAIGDLYLLGLPFIMAK